MHNARFMAVVASVFAFHVACSGGSTQGPSGGGSSGANSSSSGGSTSGGNTSSSGNASGSSGNQGSPSDGGVGPQSACAAIIGKWTATLDPGTTVHVNGLAVPVSGTIDFTLTHDDADLPNIVDFSGIAHISAQGVNYDQPMEPAKSPSGDPKDSTCDGGLHLLGQANTQLLGELNFTIDATFDSGGTSGVGQFTMKTANDDGGVANGTGGLHVARAK